MSFTSSNTVIDPPEQQCRGVSDDDTTLLHPHSSNNTVTTTKNNMSPVVSSSSLASPMIGVLGTSSHHPASNGHSPPSPSAKTTPRSTQNKVTTPKNDNHDQSVIRRAAIKVVRNLKQTQDDDEDAGHSPVVLGKKRSSSSSNRKGNERQEQQKRPFRKRFKSSPSSSSQGIAIKINIPAPVGTVTTRPAQDELVPAAQEDATNKQSSSISSFRQGSGRTLITPTSTDQQSLFSSKNNHDGGDQAAHAASMDTRSVVQQNTRGLLPWPNKSIREEHKSPSSVKDDDDDADEEEEDDEVEIVAVVPPASRSAYRKYAMLLYNHSNKEQQHRQDRQKKQEDVAALLKQAAVQSNTRDVSGPAISKTTTRTLTESSRSSTPPSPHSMQAQWQHGRTPTDGVGLLPANGHELPYHYRRPPNHHDGHHFGVGPPVDVHPPPRRPPPPPPSQQVLLRHYYHDLGPHVPPLRLPHQQRPPPPCRVPFCSCRGGQQAVTAPTMCSPPQRPPPGPAAAASLPNEYLQATAPVMCTPSPNNTRYRQQHASYSSSLSSPPSSNGVANMSPTLNCNVPHNNTANAKGLAAAEHHHQARQSSDGVQWWHQHFPRATAEQKQHRQPYQQQEEGEKLPAATISKRSNVSSRRKMKKSVAASSTAGTTPLVKGITQRQSGKWQAQIYFAGRSRYIGVFETREQAARAFDLFRNEVAKYRPLRDETVESLAQLACNAAHRGATTMDCPQENQVHPATNHAKGDLDEARKNIIAAHDFRHPQTPSRPPALQWEAKIDYKGKERSIGVFETVEDAALARAIFRQRLHLHVGQDVEMERAITMARRDARQGLEAKHSTRTGRRT